MTVGSLFAGIGGFDLGLERAGFEVKWQVEIDPFCRAVLAKHWPAVKRYEDVRECCAGRLRRSADDLRCAECGRRDALSWVDYIVGGFPCQDLSSAGKRAGLAGARSGLYREFLRIIDELRPRGVILENVHHSWRQWVPVLRRALWDLGYASLPIRLRACDFGADHERARVFVVAHVDPSVVRLEPWRSGWPFWPESSLFADLVTAGREDDRWRGADAEQRRDGPARPDVGEAGDDRSGDVADVDGQRELQPEGRLTDIGGWARHGYRWPPEPDVVRVVHGVPSRAHGRWLSDRVAALGNTVVPVEVEWIGRRILEAEAQLRQAS